MAAILVPGIDRDFRGRWNLPEEDSGPVSGEKMIFRKNAGRSADARRVSSPTGVPRLVEPPSPGWTKRKIDQTLDKSVDRANFRRKDFFAIPAIENRVELFKKSVPGGRNDVKAHIEGAEASGNFLFGAEAAAAGLSETEALTWARGAQIYQDARSGKWPSWSDNPGDAERIKDGYRYFEQRYFDPNQQLKYCPWNKRGT